MKALLQRVTSAGVSVEGRCVASIGAGMLVFLGLDRADNRDVATRMMDKILAYRMFSDNAGRMNASITDVCGGILLVSQFTLSAETRKGLRPGFSSAMPPADAQPLYHWMLECLRQRHGDVAAGQFGANMQVSLVNDGPVTFLLELS
ncbi:D-tyrosyl-tRNA(Tyr) deacylase [Kineobactrum sediminis]|uniref:D-aminoacyl-tRNA deacylase n=1 Tax=Kineobactrum sediminis TaxID=1905677 RepID=A0A2N5Y7A1_9GAMM|nr:D-aminoacyl-tRNA deacylase [Kineobactrum sediminis]PLW84272.1 D-tyrosyl-tRNA(Tyr) deacylase [Kineobactrum sediminis]